MSIFSYIFTPHPGPDFRYTMILIGLTALLIVAYFVFGTIYQKKKHSDFAFKRLFRNVPRNMIIFAVAFGFYVVVRKENIPWFSMRLWVYVISGLFVWQVYKYVQIYRRAYPIERENQQIRHAHSAARTKRQERVYTAAKKRR